jgi:hypothetical protein
MFPYAELPARLRRELSRTLTGCSKIEQFAIVQMKLNSGFYLMVFMLKVTGMIFSKLS